MPSVPIRARGPVTRTNASCDWHDATLVPFGTDQQCEEKVATKLQSERTSFRFFKPLLEVPQAKPQREGHQPRPVTRGKSGPAIESRQRSRVGCGSGLPPAKCRLAAIPLTPQKESCAPGLMMATGTQPAMTRIGRTPFSPSNPRNGGHSVLLSAQFCRKCAASAVAIPSISSPASLEGRLRFSGEPARTDAGHFDLRLATKARGNFAFVGDQEERAYELMVDRLLASPEYGERWEDIARRRRLRRLGGVLAKTAPAHRLSVSRLIRARGGRPRPVPTDRRR
jgi:hypothetical protein